MLSLLVVAVSSCFFYPIIIYYLLNNAPNRLKQAVLTRSWCAKYCPPHHVISAASSFETRKKHSKTFSDKDDKKRTKKIENL